MHAGIAKFLSKSKIPVLAIWGNNDGEKVAITKNALASGSNLTMSNRIYDFVEFDNKKMFLTHYHDLAKPMALSGQFDVVFYGHNHVKYIEQINESDDNKYLVFSITNIGTRTIRIKKIGGHFKENKKSLEIITNNFPIVLEPGEPVILKFNAVKQIDNLKTLCVWDTLDRKYYVPKKQFKGLVKQLKTKVTVHHNK